MSRSPAPPRTRARAAAAWQTRWFEAIAEHSLPAWRGVEAQHMVATMRLVDTLAEQAMLERLLEASKPRLPEATAGQHYLLATPFRYRPLHGSRFRRAGALGVWYGAAHLRTACAEVAYWRWRFICDSVGLAQQELLTEHSFLCATVAGRCIDLAQSPWVRKRALWRHGSDYSHTQALAEAARGQGVAWIRYESARDEGGHCAAALEPEALTQLELGSLQTWHCRTTRRAVRLVHGADRYEWMFDPPAHP